jgi:glycine oxidase
MGRTDICIAGAGLIGLSLALELQSRGIHVTVVEAGLPMREASTAAAGMLAADDPNNPRELLALSRLSVALYPDFIGRLRTVGGEAVPFQTSRTLQASHAEGVARLDPRLLTSTDDAVPALSSGLALLKEHSIDPRQLAVAVLAAVAVAKITLHTECPVVSTRTTDGTVVVSTARGSIETGQFVDCTGAWAADPAYEVVPVKGQMLAVALPAGFPMRRTLRTEDIYIVPRTAGPNAGRAIVGATVEDAGYDKTVRAGQIEALRRQAVALLPELEDAAVVESWSGLRPATADHLPLLGAHPAKRRHWVAAGHYRNGILLAPGTARVMTQLLLRETPSVSVEPFSPARPMAARVTA